MRRLALVSGVITIAAGVTVAGGFTLQRPELPTPPARHARVVCQPEGTQVRTDVVLASRDGVHLLVENASRAELVEIRSASDERLGEIAVAAEDETAATLAIPPGTITLTCSGDRDTDSDSSAAVLTVLDPGERWTPPELSCDETTLETAAFQAAPIPDEEPTGTARRAVPGLRGSDELAEPGYPGTLWHGDLLVVIRDGESVARITRAQHDGAWHVVVSACPGSALTER